MSTTEELDVHLERELWFFIYHFKSLNHIQTMVRKNAITNPGKYDHHVHCKFSDI